MKENPTPQSESVQNQQTNDDSETPSLRDAVAEEPSLPPKGGEGGQASSLTERGDEARNQLQEGGDGEKPDLDIGTDVPQETLENMGVCLCA